MFPVRILSGPKLPLRAIKLSSTCLSIKRYMVAAFIVVVMVGEVAEVAKKIAMIW